MFIKNKRHPSGTIGEIHQVQTDLGYAAKEFKAMYNMDMLIGSMKDKAWTPFIYSETYYSFPKVPHKLNGQEISQTQRSNHNVEVCDVICNPECSD